MRPILYPTIFVDRDGCFLFYPTPVADRIRCLLFYPSPVYVKFVVILFYPTLVKDRIIYRVFKDIIVCFLFLRILDFGYPRFEFSLTGKMSLAFHNSCFIDLLLFFSSKRKRFIVSWTIDTADCWAWNQTTDTDATKHLQSHTRKDRIKIRGDVVKLRSRVW